MRTEKEKMLAGELYSAVDPELEADRMAAQAWISSYNDGQIRAAAEQFAMLKARLGFVGAGAIVRPPFYCDYGYNIRLGAGAYLNFNCVILDVVEVLIGNGTQIGPGVHIYTADHPRDTARRKAGLEFGKPVRIGSDVWIGGAAVMLPGVTIGDGAIIGAGAVVTRDVAPGTTVVGNPARPLPTADPR